MLTASGHLATSKDLFAKAKIGAGGFNRKRKRGKPVVAISTVFETKKSVT